jgi:hypothetical protein
MYKSLKLRCILFLLASVVLLAVSISLTIVVCAALCVAQGFLYIKRTTTMSRPSGVQYVDLQNEGDDTMPVDMET